jgi:hypothetical protein
LKSTGGACQDAPPVSRPRQLAIVAAVFLGCLSLLPAGALAAAGSKHDPGFLTLKKAPSRSGLPILHVRSTSGAKVLRATLNGKRLPWPLIPLIKRRHLLRLAADDGLRFGRNDLKVYAAGRDGTYDVEKRSFEVPRTRPLAGAGSDRRDEVNAPIRLNGRRSRAARRGATLRYRWRIVQRPRGSKARLRRARSARPLLRPDAAGTYRVRLTVSEAGRPGRPARSSSDVAEVTVGQSTPPIGLPVETMVFNGRANEAEADTAIRVGEKTYWLGMPKGNSIEAVIVNRVTLKVAWSGAFPGSKANAETLAEAIKDHGGSENVVIVSNPEVLENSNVNQAFVPIVESLGVPGTSLETGRAGWSAIGVPGSKAGGWLGTGDNLNPQGGANVAGAMSGYLQVESNGNYAFTPSARTPFETSVEPAKEAKLRNTMAVGGATYRSTALESCGSGGFQVVVLLAETLEAAGNQTFTTAGCGSAKDGAGQKAMAAYLGGITGAGAGPTEGPKLVAVQSIGSPYDAAPGTWAGIAGQVARLGGTESVFAEASGGYAFLGAAGVGGFPLVETSSQLTGKAAMETGILSQDREYSFQPQVFEPSDSQVLKIGATAYQPATAWKASSTAGEHKALEYIDDHLRLDEPTKGNACFVPQPGHEWEDLRAEYCNLLYKNKWGNWAGELLKEPFPSGHGFTKGEWGQVVKELAGKGSHGEFESVSTVWALIDEYKSMLNETSAGNLLQLKVVTEKVERSIAPPPRSEAEGWWLELLGNVTAIVSYYDFGIKDNVVERATGTLSGLLFVAGQTLYGNEGLPAFENFSIEASKVAEQFGKRYESASSQLGRIGEILVSDPGKLAAVASNPEYAVNEEAVASAKEALTAGASEWAYEALLPLAYEAIGLRKGELQNDPLPTEASKYTCEFAEADGGSGGYEPFAKAPASANIVTKLPQPTLGVLVGLGSNLPVQGDPEEKPRSPSEELMKALWEPRTEGGLALYKPWFFHTTFDYPSAATKTVLCR